jgi:hypothetical protein
MTIFTAAGTVRSSLSQTNAVPTPPPGVSWCTLNLQNSTRALGLFSASTWGYTHCNTWVISWQHNLWYLNNHILCPPIGPLVTSNQSMWHEFVINCYPNNATKVTIATSNIAHDYSLTIPLICAVVQFHAINIASFATSTAPSVTVPTAPLPWEYLLHVICQMFAGC